MEDGIMCNAVYSRRTCEWGFTCKNTTAGVYAGGRYVVLSYDGNYSDYPNSTCSTAAQIA